MIERQQTIENLAVEFGAEVIAEIEKHRGSKAVGAVGDFVADIEAHRARYTKILDEIRVGANPTTLFSATEAQQKIDALAAQEIQRVRATGHV